MGDADQQLPSISETESDAAQRGGAAAALPAKKTRRARKNSIVKDKRSFRASVYGAGEAAIEGFLGKKASTGRGGYKNRYFEASGHYLKYWEKREHVADPPKGTIDLNAVVSITRGGSKDDKIFIEVDSQEHGSALVKLQGQGTPDAQRWIEALLTMVPAAAREAAAAAAAGDEDADGAADEEGAAAAAAANTAVRPRGALATELRQHVSDLLMSGDAAAAAAAPGGGAAALEGDAAEAAVDVAAVEAAAKATVELAKPLLANMQPSVRAALSQVDEGMLAALREAQQSGGGGDVGSADGGEDAADGATAAPDTCGALVNWLVEHGMVEVMLMWLLSLAETKGHQLEQQRIAASVGPLTI
jgi:hypothetical protein